jgi:hypothetical protein
MVASSATEAVGNARRYLTCLPGLCLKYTRTWLEIGSRFPDAQSAWNNARHKHTGGVPPAGAPVFWRKPGGGHGHIGLSVGGGRFRGTDMTVPRRVSEQVLSWPTSHWGYPYLGWTEDLNGVTIPWLDTTPPEEDVATLDQDDLNNIFKVVRNVLNGHPDVFGNMMVQRSTPVAAIQELADAKTIALQTKAAVDALTKLVIADSSNDVTLAQFETALDEALAELPIDATAVSTGTGPATIEPLDGV